MKRPRIALWIMRTGARSYMVQGHWHTPFWLHNWAVRRVDRWHVEQKQQELLNIWERQETDPDYWSLHRQRYYDWLFSGPRLKGVVYDAKTHSIEIGDGPIFDKLWDEFRESERSKQ